MLCSKKIDIVDNFNGLYNIVREESAYSKDVKTRIAKAQGDFSHFKKVWKSWKGRLQTKTRILEALELTVVKNGHKVLREEECDFRRSRGGVNPILLLDL